jgi:hypothetical protein
MTESMSELLGRLELREKYEKEHVGNPNVEHELSYMNWKRLYGRFSAIENRLDSVKLGTPLFDELDRESQRLARILGY